MRCPKCQAGPVRVALQPGDWVEWRPSGGWLRGLEAYAGAVGIVYAVADGRACVRFADLTYHDVSVKHLAWAPSRREVRRLRAEFRAAEVERMRRSKPALVERLGRPPTYSESVRRKGGLPQ